MATSQPIERHEEIQFRKLFEEAVTNLAPAFGSTRSFGTIATIIKCSPCLRSRHASFRSNPTHRSIANANSRPNSSSRPPMRLSKLECPAEGESVQ